MSFSIEYNLNLDIARPPPASPEELYVFDALRLYPLSEDQRLAFNPRNGQRTVVKGDVQVLLSLCDRFRTLSEHADFIAGRLDYPNRSRETIMAVLEQLRAAGMMVNAAEWLERVDAPAASPLAHGDWVLAITTCDRPALLQQLLDSCIDHLTPEIRPDRVLLLDDSRRPEHVRANRNIWSTWLGRCGLSGEYWGRPERVGLCQDLQRNFSDAASTIDWLLSPEAFPDDAFTVGQNRNLALLLTTGHRLLLLDDDCRLQPWRHPFCQDRLRVGRVPIEVIPYTDRERILDEVRAAACNPFEEHLRLLGAGLRQAFEHVGQPWRDTAWLKDLDGASRARLSADSAVRITMNATLGDPGTDGMSWLYTRPTESTRRVADYLQRLPEGIDHERLFWKGWPAHRLMYDEVLMTTTLTGVDNRVATTCLLPTGRVEDVMLGDGMQALHPDALLFAFHWALPHDPEPRRYWRRPSAHAEHAAPGPDWFLGYSIDHVRKGCEVRDPDARLAYLACRYRELANTPDEMLKALLESRYLQQQAAWNKAYLENRASGQALMGQTLSPAWQADIAVLAERSSERLLEPFELSADGRNRFRDLAARYADALRLWSELRGAMPMACPSSQGHRPECGQTE